MDGMPSNLDRVNKQGEELLSSSGMAKFGRGRDPALPKFADRYTLIEQSNILLKQLPHTIYGLCPINLLSLAMILYTIV